MTTAILVLLVLSLLAVAGTVRSLVDGGRGCAPRSHESDERFLPPARLGH